MIKQSFNQSSIINHSSTNYPSRNDHPTNQSIINHQSFINQPIIRQTLQTWLQDAQPLSHSRISTCREQWCLLHHGGRSRTVLLLLLAGLYLSHLVVLLLGQHSSRCSSCSRSYRVKCTSTFIHQLLHQDHMYDQSIYQYTTYIFICFNE